MRSLAEQPDCLAHALGAVARDQPGTDRVAVHEGEEPARQHHINHRQRKGNRQGAERGWLLQQDGVRSDQVTQVRGYADQMLRVKNNPTDPSNRRISILVKNDNEKVPTLSADGVVNGSTPLPETAKKPAAAEKSAKH